LKIELDSREGNMPKLTTFARRASRLPFSALLATALPVSVALAAETTPNIEVTATLQGDYVQDFKRVDGNWDDTLRPSRIPTTDGEFGEDGQAIISARQSGFGITANTSADGKELKGVLSFDMFGQGNNEGETTFHLKDAYGRGGPWLAGQLYTTFMDPDIFPNVVDYWGPSGMVTSATRRSDGCRSMTSTTVLRLRSRSPSTMSIRDRSESSTPLWRVCRAPRRFRTSPRTSG
jgi:hypothetical protein